MSQGIRRTIPVRPAGRLPAPWRRSNNKITLGWRVSIRHRRVVIEISDIITVIVLWAAHHVTDPLAENHRAYKVYAEY